MSSTDISRFLLQPNKHYSSVRMQQGRVPLDSDWNEGASLDDLDAQQMVLDLLGSKGSSNEGFRLAFWSSATVSVPGVAQPFDTYDFSFEAGSMFVGGLRFETEAGLMPFNSSPGANQLERFLQQADWLQVDADVSNFPAAPALAQGETREDFAYLCAWEQSVSAVEDAELLERALGGPDTSTRVRRMRRVLVDEDNTGENCADAFTDVIDRLATAENSTWNPQTCELVSNGRLAVCPSEAGVAQDPCRPNAIAGYLGAENQAIRVELRDQTHFVWGYDNASPLYRVQLVEETVEPGESPYIRVKFLNLPKDQDAQPLAGQMVELFRWGSYLPNQEKAAEPQGALRTVATSYDPDSQSLTVDLGFDANWVAWLDAHPEYYSARDVGDAQGEEKYFYLRLWDTGASPESALQTIPGTLAPPEEPGGPLDPLDPNWVDLGNGLKVGFEDLGRATDHWVVAARPATPDIVVPWALQTGLRPMGVRRYYAPLGFVNFAAGDTPTTARSISASFTDCRKLFKPLCELQGCCSITVGDGSTSFGQVNSIQAAVDQLPAEGGKICLLPGRHDASLVTIKDRTRIKIEGCGWRSVVANPPDNPGAALADGEPQALITICESTDIELCDFAIEATGLSGVRVEGQDVAESLDVQPQPSLRITLRELIISCLGDGDTIAPRSGVDAYFVNELGVHDCRVNMAAQFSPYAGIYFSRGDRGRITGNRVTVPVTPEGTSANTPWGGIQLAGIQSDTTIAGNRISGGYGHGLTLGDLIFLRPQVEPIPPGLNPDGFTLAAFYAGVASGEISNDQWFTSPAGSVLLASPPGAPCPEVTNVPNPVEVDEPGGAVLFLPVPDGEFTTLTIADNEISDMGTCGISPPAFWGFSDPQTSLSTFVFGCVLSRNRIVGNLRACPLVRGTSDAFLGMSGGVVFASVAFLAARNNRIDNNGINRVEPVVGLGAITAFNSTLEGNRIALNGSPLNDESTVSVVGPRGGIWIANALRLFTTAQGSGGEFGEPTFVFQRWAALRCTDNEVSTPNGKALCATAVGPVVVQDNSFTSFGDPTAVPLPDFQAEVLTDTGGSVPGTGRAATVQILNYGFPIDGAPGSSVFDFVSTGPGGTPFLFATLLDGGTLFQGNTVQLDWAFARVSGGYLCSALIASIDTALISNNRFWADLHEPPTLGGGFPDGGPPDGGGGDGAPPPPTLVQNDYADFIAQATNDPLNYRGLITHVFAVAGQSMQFIGNHIQEGRTDALVSGMVAAGTTFGEGITLQSIQHNHSTHCLLFQEPGAVNHELLGCPLMTAQDMDISFGVGMRRDTVEDGPSFETLMADPAMTTQDGRINTAESFGFAASGSVTFGVSLCPQPEQVIPNEFLAGGLAHMTVRGQNFSPGLRVAFFDTDGNVTEPVSIRFVDPTTLVLEWVVPLTPVGNFELKMTPSGGPLCETGLVDAVCTVGCPVAISVTPPSTMAAGINRLSISGSGFDAHTVGEFVAANGTVLPMTIVGFSAGTLTVEVDVGSTPNGTYALDLRRDDGLGCKSTLPNAFSVNLA